MIGRKERRSQQKSEVMLSTVGEHPMFGESATMEDMSSYGVRIRTERAWKPDTDVLLKSQGDWVRARVIYCHSINDKSFAVGLEFPAGHIAEAAKNWELTMRYRCPKCGKHYVVVEWKKNPKCRQCGAELHVNHERDEAPRQDS